MEGESLACRRGLSPLPPSLRGYTRCTVTGGGSGGAEEGASEGVVFSTERSGVPCREVLAALLALSRLIWWGIRKQRMAFRTDRESEMGTPLPASPLTLKARFIQRIGDDANVENIMYFTYPAGEAPLTPGTALGYADFLHGEWGLHFSPLLTTGHVLSAVQVIDLNTLIGTEATSDIGDTPGTALPPTAPAATALVVTLATLNRGRSFRGRTYFSGQPRSQLVDPQHWDPSEVAGWQTAYAAFRTACLALAGPQGPLVPSVVSYFSGKDPNPNPLSKNRFVPHRRLLPVVTPIVSGTAKSRIASQRRRSQ